MQQVPFSGVLVFCDLSTGIPRPLIPGSLQKLLFLQLHGLSHPRVQASCRLISPHFVWKNLSKHVGLRARSYSPCQKSKIQTHIHSSVPQIPVPSRRFSHLNVDLVGPLPVSGSFNYLFTMVDLTTRWPEISAGWVWSQSRVSGNPERDAVFLHHKIRKTYCFLSYWVSI